MQGQGGFGEWIYADPEEEVKRVGWNVVGWGGVGSGILSFQGREDV